MNSLRECLDVLQAETTDIGEKVSRQVSVSTHSSPRSGVAANTITESISSNLLLPAPALTSIAGKISPRSSLLGPISSPKLKAGVGNLPPDGFPREKDNKKGKPEVQIQCTVKL